MMNRYMTLLTMLCCLLGCKAQNGTFRSLPAAEFATAIADTSIVRLDVRTAAEFAEGHIAHAINIDVLKDDFEKQALKQLPKGQTIAVNCRSGKRSKTAARILAGHGYKVIELDSGYLGWIKAKLPVTTK